MNNKPDDFTKITNRLKYGLFHDHSDKDKESFSETSSSQDKSEVGYTNLLPTKNSTSRIFSSPKIKIPDKISESKCCCVIL